jgi:sec-independent protein translocase protein TatB
MFDIGWQELFVIAAVAIIVIGPKELPRTLRAVMGLVRKGRMMAREFQDGLDEVVRQADLEDVRAELERTRSELKATGDAVAGDSREVLGALEREHDEVKTILAPSSAGAEVNLPAVTEPASLPVPTAGTPETRLPSIQNARPQIAPRTEPAVDRDGAPADRAESGEGDHGPRRAGA